MRATRIPLWVLKVFGCGPNIDTLAGDITEEYSGGRSLLWVWGQVVRGIAVSYAADAGGHLGLMARAIVVAFVVIELPYWITALTYANQYDAFFVRPGDAGDVLAGLLTPAYFGRLSALSVLHYFLVGWTVRRTHQSQATAAVLSCAVLLTVLGAYSSILPPFLLFLPSRLTFAFAWYPRGVPSPLVLERLLHLTVIVSAFVAGGLAHRIGAGSRTPRVQAIMAFFTTR